MPLADRRLAAARFRFRSDIDAGEPPFGAARLFLQVRAPHATGDAAVIWGGLIR